MKLFSWPNWAHNCNFQSLSTECNTKRRNRVCCCQLSMHFCSAMHSAIVPRRMVFCLDRLIVCLCVAKKTTLSAREEISIQRENDYGVEVLCRGRSRRPLFVFLVHLLLGKNNFWVCVLRDQKLNYFYQTYKMIEFFRYLKITSIITNNNTF